MALQSGGRAVLLFGAKIIFFSSDLLFLRKSLKLVYLEHFSRPKPSGGLPAPWSSCFIIMTFILQFAACFSSTRQKQGRSGWMGRLQNSCRLERQASPSKGNTLGGRLQSKTESPFALQSFFKMKEIEQKSVGDSSSKGASECIICFDRPPNVTTNSCPHRFCSQCLLKWSKSKRTCPVCRKHYTGIRFSKRIKRYSAPSLLSPHYPPAPLLVNYAFSPQAMLQYVPPFVPIVGYLPYTFAFAPYYIT